MPAYANVSGKSNVASYELGATSIHVTFNDGSTYTYTHESAGEQNVGTMKILARGGFGLNRFINKNVKKMYSRKR